MSGSTLSEAYDAVADTVGWTVDFGPAHFDTGNPADQWTGGTSSTWDGGSADGRKVSMPAKKRPTTAAAVGSKAPAHAADTAPADDNAAAKRKKYWIVVGAGVAVLCAAGLVYWLATRKPGK